MSNRLTKMFFLVVPLILTIQVEPLNAQTEVTIHGLRQAGWVFAEKTESNEWHVGIPPYEELRRLVYVVTYTLKKEGQTMICTLARDVMYDTSKEKCRRVR